MVDGKDHISPGHYKQAVVIPAANLATLFNHTTGAIELQYIELMRFMMTREEFIGHLKGQVWKYLIRLGKKDNEVQELGKAAWYLSYLTKVIAENDAEQQATKKL